MFLFEPRAVELRPYYGYRVNEFACMSGMWNKASFHDGSQGSNIRGNEPGACGGEPAATGARDPWGQWKSVAGIL